MFFVYMFVRACTHSSGQMGYSWKQWKRMDHSEHLSSDGIFTQGGGAFTDINTHTHTYTHTHTNTFKLS